MYCDTCRDIDKPGKFCNECGDNLIDQTGNCPECKKAISVKDNFCCWCGEDVTEYTTMELVSERLKKVRKENEKDDE